jgi:hypothetical protein
MQMFPLSPHNEETHIPIRPTFEWVHPSRLNTSYWLYLSTSFDPYDPSSPDINRIAIIDDSSTTSWTQPTDLALNTTYYWQVVAVNESSSVIATSSSRSFTTIPLPANIVTPVFPSNQPGTVVIELTRPFEWNVMVGGGENIAGYRVYLGETNPPTIGVDVGNNRTWTPDPTLEYDKEYFWKVAPYTPDGGSSRDLPVWSFTTPLPPPNVARLVNPLNATVNVGIDTQFMWSVALTGTPPIGFRLYKGTYQDVMIFVADIPNDEQSTILSYTSTSDLLYATTYFWEVVPYSIAGDATGNLVWSFTTVQEQDVSDGDELAVAFETALLSNFPNPFNPETVIRFTVGNNTSPTQPPLCPLQIGGELSRLEIGTTNINKRYIYRSFSMNASNLHRDIT